MIVGIFPKVKKAKPSVISIATIGCFDMNSERVEIPKEALRKYADELDFEAPDLEDIIPLLE